MEVPAVNNRFFLSVTTATVLLLLHAFSTTAVAQGAFPGVGGPDFKDIGRAIGKLFGGKHRVRYVTPPQTTWRIYIENKCSQPVTIAVRYMHDINGNRDAPTFKEYAHSKYAHGWWRVGAGAGGNLADESGTPILSYSRHAQIAARTDDGKYLWGGPFEYNLDGHQTRMTGCGPRILERLEAVRIELDCAQPSQEPRELQSGDTTCW